MRWGGGIGVGTIHVRDPKPLGCIHYAYHRGGREARRSFSGGLKNFCREKGGGTEKCLKTGRGIANFFRCHWKITYLQESSRYL